MNKTILFGVALVFGIIVQAAMAEEKTYIGPLACMECHPDQYESFMAYSKKATSFEDIKKMEKN